MALKNTECLIGFHPGGAVDQLSSAGCGWLFIALLVKSIYS